MTEQGGLTVPQSSTKLQGSSSRSFGLDLLRIVSICGVVAIHVFGLVVGLASPGSRTWWGAVAIDIGSIWVVPVFVMISGALLLGSPKLLTSPAQFYRARALRLIPALVVWNVVYLLGVRIWLRGEKLDLPRILQLLNDGTVFTQLYFLWLIAGLYLVAPLLASFIQNGSKRRSLVTGIVVLGITVLAYMMPGLLGLVKISRPISLNFLTQWIPYVGYFLLGYALRKVRLKGLQLVAASVLTVGIGVFVVWEYGHRAEVSVLAAVSSVSYLGLAVALLAIGVFVVVLSLCRDISLSGRTAELVKTLSEATFGVFLIHLLIFELIRLNVPAVKTGMSLSAISIAYFVTLLASFLVSAIALRIPLLRRIF